MYVVPGSYAHILCDLLSGGCQPQSSCGESDSRATMCIWGSLVVHGHTYKALLALVSTTRNRIYEKWSCNDSDVADAPSPSIQRAPAPTCPILPVQQGRVSHELVECVEVLPRLGVIGAEAAGFVNHQLPHIICCVQYEPRQVPPNVY